MAIWCKSTKRTLHLPASEAATITDADPRISPLLAGEDLYISPGIRPLGLEPWQAGKQKELVGLLAFAVDVDAWSPQRAHQNLPRELADVEAIIEAASHLPSMVVRSGTGNSLHAWWVFHEAEPIADRNDLERLRRASRKFHEPMHARADAMGFHLDSTEKLNQWLRLPGSFNHKTDTPQPVEVIWLGREYAFDELYVDGRRKSVAINGVGIANGVVGVADLDGVAGEDEQDDSDDSDDSDDGSADDNVEVDPRVLDAIKNVVKRVRPDHPHKPKLEQILAGESFAESGDRDAAMFVTVSTIIFSLDRKDPLFADRDAVGEALVELYLPSFTVWANESTATKTLDERIEKFVQKINDAFDQRDEKDAEKARTAEIIRRGLKSNGVEATEEVEPDLDLTHLAIIQHRSSYYGFSFGWDANPDHRGYCGPYIKDELAAQLRTIWERAPDQFSVTYVNEKLEEKFKTTAKLVQDYGTAADEVVGSLALNESYFDVQTRTFHKAISPLRKLEPLFDPEFDEYLRITFQNSYDKFVDYLSYFLRLDLAIGAPYIEGPSGAGKGALVAGLSRFWGDQGPTDYERIAAADFNAFSVPFIVLDEGFSTTRKTSSHIRHLIATDKHTVNPKGLPQYVIKGHVRVMFTANNRHVFTQITSNEELSEDDIDAIAKRFIYFRMSDDAPSWLEARNGGKQLTRRWVEEDGIARHVLWLNQNRQAQVAPGKRFVVEGESTEIHRALVTRGEKRGLVLQWLANFATDPHRYEKNVNGSKALAKIGNSELLVNTNAVVEKWSLYGEKSPPLSVTAVGRILGQISHRYRPDEDDRVRYHRINFDHVLDWAGGDAQVGDLVKMRENFHRPLVEDAA